MRSKASLASSAQYSRAASLKPPGGPRHQRPARRDCYSENQTRPSIGASASRRNADGRPSCALENYETRVSTRIRRNYGVSSPHVPGSVSRAPENRWFNHTSRGISPKRNGGQRQLLTAHESDRLRSLLPFGKRSGLGCGSSRGEPSPSKLGIPARYVADT